ncbi:MAG: 50S ribosomal protein L6 [Thalassobium sp.]|jgi:large subunit ribosomal protein L6|uniref:Large ribosomal subunit protein uL6 n=2 Tax=Thalassolituus TaxID=187492 RepID=A0A9X2WGV2_9GAMM|nr:MULTISPECIES: 50S ribosomal protein L6 [Thalassolituus]PHS62601.1 MAG: 50S ribosomal protein L6 [Thalassobium sp.]PIQ39436.1 MAG: 50S ribosomal protein L6 [Thalassolituus sp. CG17_big_fil_post_rev_8_21_14_2_50_53_8]MCA6061177.1 50S ribosomal protein L6 [Thalassolituus sp. ST750PaO-4]MCB2388081.1 50S ribosomal protein L6 [Thalassolituus alkanivorans]MCB2424620.1 50S ribosomal protein L6 [Thalassolituus alkanivorans]|tara:strand:- start:829 stop:1362 length:534 start_codon:yes stop_codon:yes gene_type:complete
MSRVAKAPVQIPAGVEVKLAADKIAIKGKQGQLELDVHSSVEIKQEENVLTFAPKTGDKQANALAGTFRALVNNMVTGVNVGFEKKLILQGVGYRAKASGKSLNLTLGFSHPIDYELPEGISVETPSQTEVVIKGIDKQKVGQVAAEIRGYRPPEPYKGKGVRYADENVRRKEAKKK